MTLDEIPWNMACCGYWAEVQTPDGPWLRIKPEPQGDGYLVTRFGQDKQLVADETSMTADKLSALLA